MALLTRTRFLAGLVAVTLAGAFPATAAEAPTVFAAASLKNALDDIAGSYAEGRQAETTVSYAASSNTLAKQIEAGAPADVFFSADLDWMDYVAEKKLIKDDTRSNLLGNRIVLVARRMQPSRSRSRKVSIFPPSSATASWPWVRSTACRPASTARPRWRNSAPGRPSKARSPAPKACARRWRWSPRRGALWHRLPDGRRSRPGCHGRRHLPRRQPSADHLPGRDPDGNRRAPTLPPISTS
jgi:hypothetical protein